MPRRTLRLGTRRSLLARAQSGAFARAVEARWPDLSVELVGIETQGDRIVDVPLRQVEGKEFFVAELDRALASGEVDFCVHSLKDLSLDRPPGFVTAAIPERELAHDVLILKQPRGDGRLRIGTSSPRRLENLPALLRDLIPESPRLEFTEIRGNVHSRWARLHEPADSPRALEGVALAAAGLRRLWADEEGRAELARLREGCHFLALPLSACPTAPGQGALAVECRADDAETLRYLRALHSETTAVAVARERAVLAREGGGCHQAFGASAIAHPELPGLLRTLGRATDGRRLESWEWNARPASPAAGIRAWDGMSASDEAGFAPIADAGPLPAALFVAHWRAVPADRVAELARATGEGTTRVWVSGLPSWRKLAALGIWAQGCADGLGFEALHPWFAPGSADLFGTPAWPAAWEVWTHEGAVATWPAGVRARGTYRRVRNPSGAAPAELARSSHLYWSSGSQFDRLREHAAAGARHACGPGKTAAHLRSRGVSVDVFPDVAEWRRWIGEEA